MLIRKVPRLRLFLMGAVVSEHHTVGLKHRRELTRAVGIRHAPHPGEGPTAARQQKNKNHTQTLHLK